MKEKIHLQDLTLSWIEEDMDESNIGYNEESLEALLPHGPLSNLQQLCLNEYGGVKIPSGISLLSNLVNLSLYGCNRCQHLPPLDQFHSLKTLYLRRMNDLEYISERENNKEFSDSSFLPSLEQLKIEDCPNLKGWWQRQRDSVEELHNHSLPSFPHLSYLRIWKCPKLISLPLFPYLEQLVLSKCSLKPLEQTLRMEVINTVTPKNQTSIAVTSTSSSSTLATSSLQTLEIWYCTSLLAIPEWICNHTSLRTLQILECPILLKRCEREAGEDRSEIAHIPHLDIK